MGQEDSSTTTTSTQVNSSEPAQGDGDLEDAPAPAQEGDGELEDAPDGELEALESDDGPPLVLLCESPCSMSNEEEEYSCRDRVQWLASESGGSATLATAVETVNSQ